MTKQSKINHSSHKHPLVLEHPGQLHRCDGCKELGFGPHYKCQQNCDYRLHYECANPDPTITHHFKRGCTFKFHKKAPQKGKRICDACRRDAPGFVYRSAHNCTDKCPQKCPHKRRHYLHPRCATLPHTMVLKDNKLELKKKLPSPCNECGTEKSGWCYFFTYDSNYYHITCLKSAAERKFKKSRRANLETSALEIFARPSRQLVVRPGGSSKARTVRKLAKKAIKFLIAVIFGDPTSIILGLGELTLN